MRCAKRSVMDGSAAYIHVRCAAVFCCGPALSFVLRTPRPVSTEPGCSGGGDYQPSR